MEIDHVANYINSSKLVDFEELVEIALKEKKILNLVKDIPSIGIINKNLPYGDMQLRSGGSIDSSELSEYSMPELCVTANDLIVYPSESWGINGKMIYNVKILSQAPKGYHRVLRAWYAYFISTIRIKQKDGKLTKKWNESINSFNYDLWYDQDFRNTILAITDNELNNYLNTHHS